MITVLTGITESMVVRAPAIDAVLPAMIEFLATPSSSATTSASTWPSSTPRCADAAIPRSPTLSSTRCRWPGDWSATRFPTADSARWPSRFRLDHRPSHRALDDALATTDLLHLLLERAAGLGVLGLDDLIALPAIGAHPQAAKLKLTQHAAACSLASIGSSARNDQVLYVGKATNLRQRVRSYFGSDDRRKIGPLLRETQRIAHVTTPNVLTAEVLELRYIQHLAPRYNKVGGVAAEVPLRPPEHRRGLATAVGRHRGDGHRRPPRPIAVEVDRRRRDRSRAIRLSAATMHDSTRSPVHAPRRCRPVHPRTARCGDVPVCRRRRRRAVPGRGGSSRSCHDDIAGAGHRCSADPAGRACRPTALRRSGAGPRSGDGVHQCDPSATADRPTAPSGRCRAADRRHRRAPSRWCAGRCGRRRTDGDRVCHFRPPTYRRLPTAASSSRRRRGAVPGARHRTARSSRHRAVVRRSVAWPIDEVPEVVGRTLPRWPPSRRLRSQRLRDRCATPSCDRSTASARRLVGIVDRAHRGDRRSRARQPRTPRASIERRGQRIPRRFDRCQAVVLVESVLRRTAQRLDIAGSQRGHQQRGPADVEHGIGPAARRCPSLERDSSVEVVNDGIHTTIAGSNAKGIARRARRRWRRCRRTTRPRRCRHDLRVRWPAPASVACGPPATRDRCRGAERGRRRCRRRAPRR